MRWVFRNIDQTKAEQLASELAQPLKVGQFLAARRFRDSAEVKLFLSAGLKNLTPPSTMSDMEKAVARLMNALAKQESVVICGDYDADGLTATALLTQGLRDLGFQKITPRIPHRLTEGYGLRNEMVLGLARDGHQLLITVDTGVSELEAITKAVEAGLDIIVTDHHKLPPKLPPAVAIINPHRDENWRKAPLAGVGVAFMLLAALKKACQKAGLLSDDSRDLTDYLSLVAIGTIADLAPLTGMNRILVRHGLEKLSSTKHPGLVALKKVALRGGDHLSAKDVGFSLAPRLNAAGRLGSAEPALDLLLADNEAQASSLAQKLDRLNRERQQSQQYLCQEALEKLLDLSPSSRTVILGEEGWPRGLLGLAASKVAEAAAKPTVLFSFDNGLAVGSGRSVGNFNLYEALNESRHLFLAFGGHAQAAGLTLPIENLPLLAAAMEEYAQNLADFSPEVDLEIDLTTTLGELDIIAPSLICLEPYGADNPAPVVFIPHVQVADARPTNSNGDKHLRMTLTDGLLRRQVFAFNLAPRQCELTREMDVVLTLDGQAQDKGKKGVWRLLDFRQAGHLPCTQKC